MRQLKYLLSTRAISLIVIVTAIINRLIQLVFFFDIHMDHSFQVNATKNFVTGHGVSLSYVQPGNLSQVLYEPLIKWPPGYSFILSPFYVLFNHDYIIAGLTLDILFSIVFIFITRKTLRLFETPVHLVNLFTILTGFFTYYFYFFASTDEIAIPIFLIALYQALIILKREETTFLRILFFSFLLFTCAILKYQFIPVVFIIPVFLIIKGQIDHKSAIKKTGLYSFILLFLLVTSMLLYQIHLSGSIGFISSPERGFFPENLKKAYPFIPASFMRPDTLGIALGSSKITTLVFPAFQIIHIILLLLISGIVAKGILKHRFFNQSLSNSFFYLAFFLSIGITFMLAILSLMVQQEDWDFGVFWTYIEEPRYYGVVNVLIHLSVFIFYQANKFRFKQATRVIFIVWLILLLPEMIRGMAFANNRITRFGKEEYYWQYEDRLQKYADKIIIKEKKNFNVDQVVITGGSQYMNHRITLYSQTHLLRDAESINNLANLNTTKPVLVLVLIHKNYFKDFSEFLSVKGNNVAGKFDDFYFYSVYVQPH